jgi:hypothetical protein
MYDFPHSLLARILVLGWKSARAWGDSSSLVEKR